MSRIFLSHSSCDNLAAIALRNWLASEGWDDVFLDIDPYRGMAAGERWERALHESANRCEAVLFLVSANWLASGWCLKEYTLARALNKKLIALVIDLGKSIAELPPELKGTWQVVDLAGGQDGLVLRTLVPGSQEEQHVVFSRDGLRRLKRALDKAGSAQNSSPGRPRTIQHVRRIAASSRLKASTPACSSAAMLRSSKRWTDSAP
jgi:TIR domain